MSESTENEKKAAKLTKVPFESTARSSTRFESSSIPPRPFPPSFSAPKHMCPSSANTSPAATLSEASDALLVNHLPMLPSGLLELPSSTYVSGDETSELRLVDELPETPGLARKGEEE